MELSAFGLTDVGRRRQNNEDVFYASEEEGLFLVSDGMGGAAGGEVASATARETFVRHVTQETDLLTRARRGEASNQELTTLLSRALEAACADVYNLAIAKHEHAGMGATLTALLVVGRKAVIAHVGDSRIYILRGHSALQLSADHALAAELVRTGSLTAEQAKNSPYRNVLSRGVGLQPSVQVDTLVVDLLPGDRFLLCSDGLSDYVPSREWLSTHAGDGELEATAQELVAFANESGGQDNITVVLVEIAGERTEEVMIDLDGQLLDVATLLQSPIFKELGFAELQRVLRECDTHEVAAEAALVSEGDELDRTYLVVDGRLQAKGREGEALLLGAGDMVSLTAISRPRQALGSVVAVEDSLLISLSQASLERIAKRRGSLGAKLYAAIASQLAANVERAHEVLRRSEVDATIVAEIV